MPVKHFVISPEKVQLDKSAQIQAELDRKVIHQTAKSAREQANDRQMAAAETLEFVPGRVIVKVNVEFKNGHRFEDGTEIRLERQYNNFNRRETEPVNATVISAEYIPSGAEILINHNALHDTNRLFDYPEQFSPEGATDIRYYSLPEDDCYAWRTVGGFQPLKGFEFGLRCFRPYSGLIQGIEPKIINDTLFVLTGELAGKVVGTLKASDYEIVYRSRETGQEERLIRFRHSDKEEIEREEVMYINDYLTEQVLEGEILVGLSPTNCKTISNA